MERVKINAFIGLLLASALWGMSYVFSKSLIQTDMGNITIIFFRSFIASVTLLLISGATGKLQRIHREHLKTMFALALCQPFAYFIFELSSMIYNSATITSLIISMVPLWIPFVLFVVEKERVAVRSTVAVVVSVGGVVLVLLGGADVSLMTSPLGLLLVFSAMSCAVAYSMIARKLTSHYNALTITTYQNIIGFVLFLPLFFVFDYSDFSWSVFSASACSSILMLGVFCSAFAYLFYINAIKYFGVVYTTMFNNVSPIFTVVGAFLMFGERLVALQFLGIAITIAGLFIGSGSKKSNKE